MAFPLFYWVGMPLGPWILRLLAWSLLASKVSRHWILHVSLVSKPPHLIPLFSHSPTRQPRRWVKKQCALRGISVHTASSPTFSWHPPHLQPPSSSHQVTLMTPAPPIPHPPFTPSAPAPTNPLLTTYGICTPLSLITNHTYISFTSVSNHHACNPQFFLYPHCL